MGRLKGLASFVFVAGAVLLLLRGVHVAVPLIFPDTRPGPFVLASLGEVQRRVGFAPLLPAYHPGTLGDRPASLTVTLNPYPTFVAVWRGERFLSITERRGGTRPDHPPTARPLLDVADSTWWRQESMNHLLVRRGALWIELVTDLPTRDLARMADTLSVP